MLTAADQQVLTAYEDLGLSPEQIAETQGFDVAAVKVLLAQFSKKYRDAVDSGDKSADFDDKEAIRARETIAELAQFAEDDHLRFRAARYIRDDKKGRLDADKLKSVRISVLQINQQMAKALEAVERGKAKQLVDAGQPIDV